MAADFVEERDEFPERRATNAVTMELSVRINETIRDWADWAEVETASWPPVRRQRRAVAAGAPARAEPCSPTLPCGGRAPDRGARVRRR